MGLWSAIKRTFGGSGDPSTVFAPRLQLPADVPQDLPTERATRLAIEKLIIDRYFPGFVWHNPSHDTYVVGQLRTNPGSQYQVKIRIPDDYPRSMPLAYIISPSMPSHLRGTSGANHTLSPDADGHPQICHGKPGEWVMSDTIYQVLLKMRLWVEAYEAHRQTGGSISQYLKHVS